MRREHLLKIGEILGFPGMFDSIDFKLTTVVEAKLIERESMLKIDMFDVFFFFNFNYHILNALYDS